MGNYFWNAKAHANFFFLRKKLIYSGIISNISSLKKKFVAKVDPKSIFLPDFFSIQTLMSFYERSLVKLLLKTRNIIFEALNFSQKEGKLFNWSLRFKHWNWFKPLLAMYRLVRFPQIWRWEGPGSTWLKIKKLYSNYNGWTNSW